MPRANRCFLPGYAWHITHRYHKHEFLLKFKCDHLNWKRFGLCVLNYIATSNHIHLLEKSFPSYRTSTKKKYRDRCNSVATDIGKSRSRRGTKANGLYEISKQFQWIFAVADFDRGFSSDTLEVYRLENNHITQLPIYGKGRRSASNLKWEANDRFTYHSMEGECGRKAQVVLQNSKWIHRYE